jgi:hypothetical protein
MEAEAVKKYVEKTEDELFIDLANATTGPGLLPTNADELVRLGKARFREVRELVVSKICDPKVRAVLSAEDDRTKLAILVADTLASVFTGVPLVAISALIAKIGLDAFCPRTA